MQHDVLYVFKNNNSKNLVGQLAFTEVGCRFSYDHQYLLRGDSESLHPFLLPLTDRASIFQELNLEGALSVFKDALPGAWGRAVLNSLAKRNLSDAECLLEDQFDRIGDLVFNREKTFPVLAPNNYFDWQELMEAKDRIEQHQSLTEKQQLLLKQGSSQGGARPKISLIKDNKHYLVKLPSIKDGFMNVPQIEHGTLCLANACDINSVKSNLLRIGDRDVLMVERFDRTSECAIPYMSLASACGLRSQDTPSYLDFADEMPRFGATHDLEELFRRMLFNILVSNKDDHQFNHGLIKTGNQWRLSPAFDIVAGEGSSRVQSMVVGKDYRDSTIANALSKCDIFRLTKAKATDIAWSMVETIQNKWQTIFYESGVSAEMINQISWAMVHPDTLKDFEKPALPIDLESVMSSEQEANTS